MCVPTALFIVFTQLFGWLPDDMASLQRLVLNHVSADEYIPEPIVQAHSLTSLELLRGGCHLKHAVDIDLSHLTALQHVALTINCVPAALLMLPQLRSLVLDGLHLDSPNGPEYVEDYAIHVTQSRSLSKLSQLTVSRPR